MRKIDLIVGNVYLMDPTTDVLREVSVACHQGLIVAIDNPEFIASMYQGEENLFAQGKYLCPGLINTHTHTFQTLLKGIGRDLPLIDWLNASVRKAIPRISDKALYTATLCACMDAISSGTTTLLDYAYTNITPRSMESIGQALNDSGIRGVLGLGFSEKLYGATSQTVDLSESIDSVCARVLDMQDRFNKSPMPIFIAPTAIWNFTEDGLKRVSDFADTHRIPITMHINETTLDNRYCQERYRCSCTELLERTGILDQRLLAVHCIVMDDADIARFKAHRVGVSYNPVSNLLLGSGISPIQRFLDAGLRVSFGTDGAGSNDTQNLMDSIRIGTLVQKGLCHDPTIMKARQVVGMATRSGAQALGLGEITGKLEVGRAADFMLLDFSGSYANPVRDPFSAFIYQAERTDVAAVFIRGEKIYAEGKFTKIDKEAILADIRSLTREMGL